jgi:sugar phosphate isomerase/epimerase
VKAPASKPLLISHQVDGWWALAAAVGCGSGSGGRRVQDRRARGANKVRAASPARGGSYDALLAESRRDFEWVADCATRYGVRAVTPLHHEWVNSSASACRRLLEGFDPTAVGIIADFGHHVIEGGEDLLATVQILGPYLDSVMLKNFGWFPAKTRRDGTVEWEYQTMSLREGRLDVPKLMAALNAEGFDGWITICETAGSEPQLEKLADVLRYVRQAEATTAEAVAEEWVYDYAPIGGQ